MKLSILAMFRSILPIFFLSLLWFFFSGQRSLFFLITGFCTASGCYTVYLWYLRPLCNFSIIFSLSSLKYMAWLIGQIFCSSFSLLRFIYSKKIPSLNSDKQLILRKDIFTSDILNTLFGLSVTLTPGTVTVLVDGGGIYFHCFSETFCSGISEIKNYISNSFPE